MMPAVDAQADACIDHEFIRRNNKPVNIKYGRAVDVNSESIHAVW